MNVVMIGSGYVGLVSGACFAEFGIDVRVVDKDPAKAVLKKDGGDIDAISGVTVSSVAVADAVKQASGWYAALKDTIKTTW